MGAGKIVPFLFVFILSACSLFEEDTRTLHINAFSNSKGIKDPGGPVAGAVCSVAKDDKVIGYIISPGSIKVDRNVDEVFIICHKDGYNEGSSREDLSRYSTNEETYVLLTKE